MGNRGIRTATVARLVEKAVASRTRITQRIEYQIHVAIQTKTKLRIPNTTPSTPPKSWLATDSIIAIQAMKPMPANIAAKDGFPYQNAAHHPQYR